MSKSRSFCFTLNNYTLDQENWLINWSEFKYVMLAQEIGESGTPHLQGYCVFKSPRSLSGVQKGIQGAGGPKMHLEISKGSFEQNLAYIQGPYDGSDGKHKDLNPSFREAGQRPSQGMRTDIEAAYDYLKSGKTINDAIVEGLHLEQVVKYSRGMQMIQTALMPSRSWKTEIWWLHGPTGSGKSRWAQEQTEMAAYVKMGGNKWWCGYHGQPDVILDDFRPTKEIPLEYLLNLLDRYPMLIETKGGTTQMIARRIYITTPKGPLETFVHWEWLGQENLAQLQRRIEHVIEFPQMATSYNWLPRQEQHGPMAPGFNPPP